MTPYAYEPPVGLFGMIVAVLLLIAVPGVPLLMMLVWANRIAGAFARKPFTTDLTRVTR